MLKSWRSSAARDKKIPAYMVLHDATLIELARKRPTTEQALRGVKGLGPSKVENYGSDILRLICSETDTSDT